MDTIKQLIERLHSEHGGDGEPLRCVECVVGALNQLEFEAILETKRRLGGE